MNIAAFDLGNTTGIAFNFGNETIVTSRRWSTDREDKEMRKTRMDRRRDPRVVRFFECVRATHADIIVFEDVLFVKSRIQAHLWSAYRAALWLAAGSRMVECVATGTLKRFATGNGSADKNQMGLALKRSHPTLWSAQLDDNAVDAAWLWVWAQKNLSRTPLMTPLDKQKPSATLTPQ